LSNASGVDALVLELSVIPETKQARPRPLGTDPQSFRSFYDEALPHVYGYLLHRCGGPVPTAEDLTQETFLAAVAELRKGREIDNPPAWVIGIARHKLLDHYRRQARAERVVTLADDEAVDLPVDGGDGARERTIAALALVPATQRAVIVLRHLDGYSVPEVAGLLGRSVEAVESLLARGRVSFRRAYLEVSA
jgi:RNA polymerase sigma-70 factor (ECF subfamily)